MKQILPQNVLLIMALVATGAILLYNTVIRDSYATTLRYAYPVAEQQAEPPAPAPVKEVSRAKEMGLETAPETGPETAAETEAATESATELVAVIDEEAVAGVQFPLDINAATVEEILLIPGVGNAMAEKIVQYRDYLGGAYTDLAELQNISGVGEATYNKLWSYFYISENGEAYAE